MKISRSMEIVGLGIKIGRTLVIGDLHIGYEESLNRKGFMLPRFHLKDTLSRLERMLKRARPDTIIINGDIKHDFSAISSQEWRETLKIIDFLLKSIKEVVLVRGNHDIALGQIAGKRGVNVLDRALLDEGKILILHGHIEEDIPDSVRTIIISHEHPAVSITDGPRSETFKCFLRGKYKGKELIVMPSFTPASEGSDILQEKRISPFLQQDISSFEVFVAGEKTYNFGRISGLKKLGEKN